MIFFLLLCQKSPLGSSILKIISLEQCGIETQICSYCSTRLLYDAYIHISFLPFAFNIFKQSKIQDFVLFINCTCGIERVYIYSLAFCGFQRKFISSPQASLTVFIDLENGFLYYTSQAVSISVKIVQTA